MNPVVLILIILLFGFDLTGQVTSLAKTKAKT